MKGNIGNLMKQAQQLQENMQRAQAEIADRERQRSQVRAIAEIEQDPFVRDLVENFDARVNEASIKPIQ